MKSGKTVYFITGLIILFLIFSGALVNVYTDWMFFQELQFKPVFIKILSTQVSLGLIFGLFSVAFIMVNVIIANKAQFAPLELFFDGQTSVSLNIAMLSKWIKPLSIILGILAGIYAGLMASNLWNEFLLFKSRMDVSLSDPIFGKNISFYIFRICLTKKIRNQQYF
jgi:uncharacterized membrane protein (UPF0182 family)